MKYKAVGTNILVEEIILEDDQQIIADKEEFIVKGRVLNVGNNTGIELPHSQESRASGGGGMGMLFEVVETDIVFFNKRQAQILPFSDKLYIVDQSNILVVEEN